VGFWGVKRGKMKTGGRGTNSEKRSLGRSELLFYGYQREEALCCEEREYLPLT